LIASADGIHLTDTTGHRVIDAWSGMVCVGLGYGRDDLIDVMTEQTRRLSYAHSLYDTTHQTAIDLCERLVDVTPASLEHVFLSMSGSDAADTLLKVIRYHNNVVGRPRKKHVIALDRAYHGANSAVAGLTRFPECNDHFDVPLPTQHHIPSPWHFGANEDVSADEIIGNSVAALRGMATEIGVDQVAAFVCEPVMITAGVIVPPLGWLGAMADTCAELDIFFMVDEVVTGFGRTGRMFACEWDDVEPDMMFLAKGMTSGYIPQGAALFSNEIYRGMTEHVSPDTVFGHGFTHTGHPPSCAVTLKCIDLYSDLVDDSARLGLRLLARLNELADRDPWITHVRGRGLAAGVDVLDSKTGRPVDPTVDAMGRIRREAHRRGLMTRMFDGDMFGFAPPLIITDDQIDEMIEIFGASVTAVRNDEDGG
jgi:adenosylmethionine-8-amino-7-oxononanoate aminotransferase